jgi:ribonuclease T
VAKLTTRFRGFMPVVVDVETGGFDWTTDALLEVAAIFVELDETGMLVPTEKHRFMIKPFAGANIEPASLQVTGIEPFNPLRPALDEGEALRRLFTEIRRLVKAHDCNRAVLVGHNSFFDLQFLNAAVARCQIKRNPFHPFSSFDTATLAGVAFGQTVLSRAIEAAGGSWDDERAHSALYDAEQTAFLFCKIVNRFRGLYEASLAGASSG